jgi:hypothetical protein
MKNKSKSFSELEKSDSLKIKILTDKVAMKKLQEQDKEYSEEKELEYEIDCPRCKDVMILCSEFDSLYYLCYNCDFYLYALK